MYTGKCQTASDTSASDEGSSAGRSDQPATEQEAFRQEATLLNSESMLGESYSQYYNDDTEKRRPDVEYHLFKHVAVDLSIVKPDDEPGSKAQTVANKKVSAHKAAVEAMGHIFVPVIIETTGYVHADTLELINVLANHLHPWMKPFFRRDMFRALSVSLQRQKTLAVTVAAHKHRDEVSLTSPDPT